MKIMFLAILLCFTGVAMGQQAEAVKAETAVPDAGPQGTDRQIDSNTARIEVQEKMSGNQNFTLNLLGILVPAIVLVMQLKLSKQVNGMKHELVEEVRKAALLQGAKTERESHTAKVSRVAKVAKSKSRK